MKEEKPLTVQRFLYKNTLYKKSIIIRYGHHNISYRYTIPLLNLKHFSVPSGSEPSSKAKDFISTESTDKYISAMMMDHIGDQDFCLVLLTLYTYKLSQDWQERNWKIFHRLSICKVSIFLMMTFQHSWL